MNTIERTGAKRGDEQHLRLRFLCFPPTAPPKMGSVSPSPQVVYFLWPQVRQGSAGMAAWVGAWPLGSQADNQEVRHIYFYYGCISAQTIPCFPSLYMNTNGPKLSACMISGLLN